MTVTQEAKSLQESEQEIREEEKNYHVLAERYVKALKEFGKMTDERWNKLINEVWDNKDNPQWQAEMDKRAEDLRLRGRWPFDKNI